MARYVTLLRFTDPGARALKQSAARAAKFRQAAQAAGVQLESQLWTTGSVDGILILSGDETKILKLLSGLVAQGNVRTETLQAFDAAEMKALTR